VFGACPSTWGRKKPRVDGADGIGDDDLEPPSRLRSAATGAENRLPRRTM
jgi:hypothetical protein